MDIEKLLECSASELEAMSNEQLMEHFKPYLDVTRPDRVIAAGPTSKTKNAGVKKGLSMDDKMDKINKLAEQFGFDMGDMD